MGSSHLLDDVKQILSRSAFSTPTELEVLLVERESRAVGWAEEKPHLQNEALTKSACVRILDKGGEGLVTSTVADPAHLQDVAKKAFEIAQVSARDPLRRLAGPAPVYPNAIPVDSSLFGRSTGDLLESLATLEKKILKTDPRIKKVVRMNYHEEKETRALGNSNRLFVDSAASEAAFVVEVLAVEGRESQVAWDFRKVRFSDDLHMDKLAASVAEDAVKSLGGRSLSSGKYPVVVLPRVGTQLLSLFSEALSAENVQFGKSFLKGHIGKSVAGSLVTLIDDPLLPRGVASAPFDDEGIPHQTMTLVSAGMLRDYFYDIRSAAKEKRESNGHGLKSALSARPKPAPTNFYMKPGQSNFEQMLAADSRVFVLHDVMGLHMADEITGEFSLGASGALYENGRYAHPVRGVTIAGQVGTFLKNVSVVGDDLTWFGSLGAPSFLVSQVTIAGN